MNWHRTIKTAALVLSVGMAGIGGAAEMPGQRKLTYRDWGVYCGSSYNAPEEKRQGWTYFDPSLFFAENPWDFFILQVPNESEAMPELKRVVDEINRQGKVPILQFFLFEDDAGRERVDFYAAKEIVDHIFSTVKPEQVQITLGEENVYWGGRAEVLRKLYEYIKSAYPGTTVYQWYTNPITPDRHAQSGWTLLPSDGWIVDNYCTSNEVFEKQMVRHLGFGVPVVNVIWASPDWPLIINKDKPPERWWHEFGGREQFESQLRICREYNIPVAFFVTENRTLTHPVQWGWLTDDPVPREFYKKLCAMALEADFLPAEQIGFRRVSEEKIRWAESTAAPLKLDVNSSGYPQMQWTWRPDDPAERNPLCQVTMKLESSENNTLLRSAGVVGIKGIAGKSGELAILVTLDFARQVEAFSLTLLGSSEAVLGGGYEIFTSVDGQNWTSAETEAGKMQLAGADEPERISIYESRPTFFDRRTPLEGNKIYWRIVLKSTSGVATEQAAAEFRGFRLTTLFQKGSWGEQITLQ